MSHRFDIINLNALRDSHELLSCPKIFFTLSQVERSPVHEVVDIGDSGDDDGGEEDEEDDEDREDDEEEMRPGTLPLGVGGAEESVMVLDSDSDSDDDDEEEGDYGRGGQTSSYYQQSHPGFRALPGEQCKRGDYDVSTPYLHGVRGTFSKLLL